MRSSVQTAFVALLVAGTASPALAQASDEASVTTTGTTTIIAPITLTEDSDLAFGSVVRPSVGSGANTVTLDPALCTTDLSGPGNAAVLNGSSSQCATYTVDGEDGLAFDISTPASFTMSGPANLVVALTSSATSGTIGTDDQFAVGGSFNVTDATPAGAYSGNFTVTVSYQ